MGGFTHRRRFLVGLGFGLGLGLAAASLLLAQGRHQLARLEHQRRAVVELEALAEVLGGVHGSGEAIRATVERWVGPAVTTRVLLFDGTSLEASTDPADRGERGVPRR